ncbi:protein kinase domain-containing protein [Thalassotalea sp. PLHSN55]|uniref:protein kinase domain-containing protein n=1 Tax=Thalassotalea sp. PLHSN55 TaxID=3435888 RepID=UPI003F84EE7F
MVNFFGQYGQKLKQDNNNSNTPKTPQCASDCASDCADFNLADTLVVNQNQQSKDLSSKTDEALTQAEQNSDTVSDNRADNGTGSSAEHQLTNSMAHFKIIDILGKGGMGAVYKAKDLALERFVAMKMLRLHANAGANAESLILAEAKTISKLNHPNIVTVYDIARDTSSGTSSGISSGISKGESAGESDANFIVMEWVNGQPLNNLIPAEGLPLKTVLYYAKQIIAALHCAHQQDIIHRDIKPQNIMVTSDGRIKVLDFGIAALMNVEQQAPLLEFSGSPQYMSPEQISGKACDVRSDLFSLGIVLYEMLAGVKPFLGMNITQISQAISEGQYTPLAKASVKASSNKVSKKGSVNSSNKTQNIPAELVAQFAAVVDKLLRVDPEQRFQSADELAVEINAIDEKVNQKNSWWQQQHWVTKTFIILPIITVLAFSLRSVFFPPSTQELIARQLVESKKIAFLPFDNISGDPVLQIFSDGIATMLSSDLAEVGYQQGDGKTWVLPSSELRQLDDPSITGVYNKYGVDFIVTGSIQHMGSTRSVHLSLVNGSDGRQLKSTQLTINANALFAAQTEIRQQVMTLLGWHMPENLNDKFAQKKPAFDGAYKHYLQGQGYLYRFDHGDNINNAVQAFEKAIALDTSYGDAYVGLAQAQLRSFLETKQGDWLTNMANTIDQLAAINREHVLLSYLQGELSLNQGQYQQAVQLFQQSINSQPNFIKAYTGLADAYIALGEQSKAEKVLLSAYKKMPNNIAAISKLGAYYFGQGDYLKALNYFKLQATNAPNNYTAYLNISACYYSIGEIGKAIKSAKHSISIERNADGYANLGTAYFILKDYQQAVAAYEQMIHLNDSDFVNWGNLADAYRFANNDKYLYAFKQAILRAEQALQLNPNNKYAIALLSYYYANLNHLDKSNSYSKLINENDTGVDNFFVAAAYSRLNKKEAAMRHLEFAISNSYSINEILNSPLFENLKDDDKYHHLIGKSGH